MANQLALVALIALVAIFAAFAEVSAYRTTIITTTTKEHINGFPPYVDGLPTEVVVAAEDNPRERERCRKQIQGRQLNHCHMHLSTYHQGTSTSFESSILQMTQQEDQLHLQLCCDQLKKVNEQCQCEAIKKVVQQASQMQQGGKHQGSHHQQQQQVLRKARMLPNQCKLQLQRCPL